MKIEPGGQIIPQPSSPPKPTPMAAQPTVLSTQHTAADQIQLNHNPTSPAAQAISPQALAQINQALAPPTLSEWPKIFVEHQKQNQYQAAAELLLEAAETPSPEGQAIFKQLLNLAKPDVSWSFLERLGVVGNLVMQEGKYQYQFDPKPLENLSASALQTLHQTFRKQPTNSPTHSLLTTLEIAGANLKDPQAQRQFIQKVILNNEYAGSESMAKISQQIKTKTAPPQTEKALLAIVQQADLDTLHRFLGKIGFYAQGPIYNSEDTSVHPKTLGHLSRPLLLALETRLDQEVNWYEYILGSKDLRALQGIQQALKK